MDNEWTGDIPYVRVIQESERWKNSRDIAKNDETVKIKVTFTSEGMMDMRLLLHQKLQITFFSKLGKVLDIV